MDAFHSFLRVLLDMWTFFLSDRMLCAVMRHLVLYVLEGFQRVSGACEDSLPVRFYELYKYQSLTRIQAGLPGSSETFIH